MLSLTREGVECCKIIGGENNNQIISLNENSTDGFKKYNNRWWKIQLIPNKKTERQILYITGPSGSGKSTFSRKYLEQYKKKLKYR